MTSQHPGSMVRSARPAQVAALVVVSFLVAPAGLCRGEPQPEPAPTDGLRVGIATTTITPQGPVYMAGFASRKEQSTGVYDDLVASCLVFDDGQTRVGLMAIDIIGIGPLQLADIRAAAAEVGIPARQMMVNSSHTHCGPIFERNGDFPTLFKERTCGLLKTAVGDLQPATVDYAVGSCTMGISRRYLGADGKASWRPASGRPMDMATPVMRVRGADGQVRAVCFGYGCHPTAMGGLQVGPDYPGFARGLIATTFPDCLPVFLQGCGGDIKPRSISATGRFEYKSMENLAELGHELGRAVLAAMCCEPLRLAPVLGGATRTVNLPTKKDPQKTSSIEVQVIRIGGLSIVGINGEVFAQIGMRIKRELAGKPVWVNGYSNRRVGYIPTAAAYPEGGYEVDISRYSPAAEGLIVTAALDLVRELHEAP